MDSKIYESILKTVCYADIFDFPLTEGEVKLWINRKNEDLSSSQARVLREGIKTANGVIVHKKNFLFLQNRENIINERQKRKAISTKKILIAQNIVSILKHIPTIKLIGVSGSVAMDNAAEKDDIDLFIVTQSKTIWLTRFMATILVELFGKRRRPGDIAVADKICLNMFVDENYLSIPKEKRNIYTAHEVCQLKVLYEKDDTYKKFITANIWVTEFLPNAITGSKYYVLSIKKRNTYYVIPTTYYILEWLAKKVQLWYMSNRLTNETVSDRYLAFHPKDYTQDVLAAFEKRVKFYASQV